jgi:hypothetical protein
LSAINKLRALFRALPVFAQTGFYGIKKYWDFMRYRAITRTQNSYRGTAKPASATTPCGGENRNGNRRRPANAHFSIGKQLNVGYNGWYDCR